MTVPGLLGDPPLVLRLDAGDELRTELSCKYTRDSLTSMAEVAGLRIANWYTDPQQLFALALLRRRES